MPNKKTNQKCWNCDHFQPYIEGDEPLDAYGECRRKPLNTMYGQIAGDFWAGMWPFISNGTVFWCGAWQKSVQTVPKEPEYPRDPPWPSTWEQWIPWNKKDPMNVECWNCNHFQVSDKNDPPNTKMGQCRRMPPPEVINIEIAPSVDVVLQGVKTEICGDSRWCGMWEMSEEPIPEKPPAFCTDFQPQRQQAIEDMTKADLIEYAGAKEIAINSSDTKAVILAAIKAATP